MRNRGCFRRTLLFGIVSCLVFVLAQDVEAAGNSTHITGGAASLGRDENGAIVFDSIIDSGSGTSDNDLLREDSEGITLSITPIEKKEHTGTILEGVYAENVNLSGMTYDQAVDAISGYVDEISCKDVVVSGGVGEGTAIDCSGFNPHWIDNGILDEAFELGQEGNFVQQYKARKDLQHENKVYPVEIGFNQDAVRSSIQVLADQFDQEAVDATLQRDGNGFSVIPGQSGFKIDVNRSADTLISELEKARGGSVGLNLTVEETQPKGSAEDLSMVKDLLGSFTTSFSSSGSERSGNVKNGTRLVNGTVLLPGEQFSMYETVSPFTEENGYYMAGSYLNGMVVESLGGGICQVSSTLYNAVLRAELQIDERSNHSMIVTYVKMSSDAAISGTSKDFKFTNSSQYPIYIEGYTTADKSIVFNVYGVETRPSNRTLEFESVELSKTEPDTEKIVLDSTLPIGEISVQSAHTGYQGEFWKIVKVDGVEKERVQINRSTYQPTPKTATVGVASDNAAAVATITAAAESGSIDYVKSVVAGLIDAAAGAPTGGAAEAPAAGGSAGSGSSTSDNTGEERSEESSDEDDSEDDDDDEDEDDDDEDD